MPWASSHRKIYTMPHSNPNRWHTCSIPMNILRFLCRATAYIVVGKEATGPSAGRAPAVASECGTREMAVYVDDMWRFPMGRYGRMKMSHMAAGTTEELLEMADCIDLSRRWLQDEGLWSEHFDISMSKRRLAVKNGAIEVTMRELVSTMRSSGKSSETRAGAKTSLFD